MIIGIEGKIEVKEPTKININVNGLIYEVFISINCSSSIIKDNIKLHTTQIIKEDSNNLYGFLDLNEKKMFDTVIKINGVGPKVALAICSTFTPEDFVNIIQNNDVDMLKKVPGIGPKGASRILVELNDFIIDNNVQITNNENINKATQALESLGFKQEQIKKVLKNCNLTNDISSLIKEALKQLQK
ncbi:MAG: Holliday junction branch migration protein RuvA [Campylobacterota bacterium]|nr:Holliday junction branch migration protein RuvA [Campylobacterota bacterium]